MRPLLLISALVWAGCAAQTEPRPPPTDRLAFPTGIVHRKVNGSPNGALYVASSNFDKCFDTGAVIALDLDDLGLPEIGGFPDAELQPEPEQFTDLKVDSNASVQIESFAGQMDVWNSGDGSARLFVPTRAENNYLHAINVAASDKTSLTCAQTPDARDCLIGALSLTSNVEVTEGEITPSAPGPLGVRVALNSAQDPEVWVTHLEAADSPEGSGQNIRSYVVRVPGREVPTVLNKDNFFPLGSTGLSNGAAHATAIGSRYAYVTGRSYVANDATQPAAFLLRLVDRDDPSRVLETSLRLLYSTIEARDIAVSRTRVGNTERLYIVARAPDTLLVVDVAESESLRPTVSVVDAVPLPDGANQLVVLDRGTLGDLVAVTATTTRVVVLYDAALGQIVSQVDNVGLQPFGITADVDVAANKARLYVTTFGDGRVAVIDIANLAVAQDARLVAHLGAQQGRDQEQGTSTCERQEIDSLKRIILCLAVGAGLIAACSETQAVTTAAGLSGTYDLTIAGRYVFVTSSDRNELRVLDLEASPRDFVRAPNPLEALAIPVLERPTYLTRDVYYRMVDERGKDEEGKDIILHPKGEEIFGPYIYARSDGAQQISIVSATASDERNLRELHRLRLKPPQPDEKPGIITAFAARGPGRGTESILYYATQSASVATLWRQALPGPDDLSQDSVLSDPAIVQMLPGETVAALLVLPSDRPTSDNPPEQEYVVVATRGTQGATGRTFRLDVSNPQAPVVTYAFAAPVRLLATHPVVANTYWEGDLERTVDGKEIEACGIDNYPGPNPKDPTKPDGEKEVLAIQPQRTTLWAGEYLFGVLDESTCGGAVACSGVIAVDSVTGQVPRDATNVPMLPIRVTSGLPTGLTLVKDARIYTRCASATDNHNIPRPLVGIVPTSDGQISLFDAVKLRPFDLDASGPNAASISVIGPLGENKTPALPPSTESQPPPLVTTEVRNGATRSDTYRMFYEGLLPPSRRRAFSVATNCPAAATECTFEVGSTRRRGCCS